MTIIDCIGDVCPMPVIKTKRALAEAKRGCFEIHVDNGISLENVKKYIYSLGYDTNSITRDGYFAIIVDVDGDAKRIANKHSDSIVAISGNTMGHGDDELGHVLMKSFVFALTQLDNLPQKIVLYNSGVLLALEDSPVLADLQTLSAAGVQILSCGLCIDYFNCANNLAVGEITNMYVILEMMQDGKVIRP
ncbi:MAG: sulfurtransferase-like selenium metabolism protein YedF [Defluviitaleaceae bacterium]|nr:sulfurtransferase-like selenium metabolism protein YedF [Defluviitaleaceae bacterium]